MKKKKVSIDGFVSRRSSVDKGTGIHGKSRRVSSASESAQELHSADVQQPNHERPRVGVARSDIDDSLRNIDEPEHVPHGRRKTPKTTKTKYMPFRRKLIKRFIIILFIIGLVVVGFVAIRAIETFSKSFKGNIFDFGKAKELKMDSYGRSNVLVFGTAEDDEGGEHEGKYLTDSIMIVSIDQNNKDAYMVSVPRDLWVTLETPCEIGYEAKINTVFMCASNDGKNEEIGAQALQEKVKEITGIDTQYYAHINFSVVKDAVDAVDGINVKIESEDPRGIYDPNFDWKCNHTCHMVDYKNGEIAHLDGEHALALARARNAAGGYGLPNSNFDREKNQQKIVRALQKKAISVGTLTNVGRVTKLMSAMGDNLRTNFEGGEVRTLTELSKEINGERLKSLSLVDEDEPVLTTGDYQGQSVVHPVAGLYDYGKIASYLRRKMSSDPMVQEAAIVAVYNGSGVPGRASEVASELEAKGFNIGVVDNAPAGTYDPITIYQIGYGNDATKTKLASMYGVTVTEDKGLVYTPEETDFVVIVGKKSETLNR